MTQTGAATVNWMRDIGVPFAVRGGDRLPCQQLRTGARSGYAAHNPRTTKLYDRTKERLMQDEVERIRF